ncbi:MAG TPA: preprotein translocase subunit SecG [Gammaproteobacteria bacterium]|nr:preprotein translocase subunit SecG [Gammaproteobacteria bacterium]
MYNTILVFHVILAIAVVGLVLLQQGKGADAGAAFGSGASATVFGARGSGNFLTRVTAVLATLFFVTSLSLAVLAKQLAGGESVVDTVAPETPDAEVTVPVEAPAPAEAPAPEAAPGTDAGVAPTEGVPTAD